MTRKPASRLRPPPQAGGEATSYAELLAALEARRRATDDILLRKMIQVPRP